MRSTFLRALFVCLAIAGLLLHKTDSARASSGGSSGLVISQVYGGGGNSNATYKNDFVELFNRGASPVTFTNWSIQYSSNANASAWTVTATISGTLQPGQYFLIAENGGATGAALPTPDATGSTNLNASNAKVALVSSATAISGQCPADPTIVDLVGYGTNSAPCFEGTAPAPSPSNNATSDQRAAAGCTDTDNNSLDFTAGAPTPRNTATPVAPCGGGDSAPTVTGTTPSSGANNVAVTSTIVITFSESVTASTSAFSLECPAGSPRTFTQTGSPAVTFTLTPNSPLPAGITCAVKVTANQVTDTDTSDPPDTMTADYSLSFTTVSPTDTAPFITSATPPNGANNVAVNSPIVITFSESVTASPTAFSLQCPAGVPQAFNQSGSPATTVTLTPSSPLPYSTNCTVAVTADQIADSDTNDPPDGLASSAAFSFTTAAAPPPGAGIVRINEVDADTPGSDTAEFVELYDGGAGNTPLDGLVVVFFDGTDETSNNKPSTGKLSYAAFDLDGYSTDANGYFVMGNPGVPGVSLTFNPGDFGLLQNGPDAVGLYIGNAGDFPNGTIATTTNLQDAIVYGTDDPTASGLLPLLNAGQAIVNENATGNGTTQSSQRCPNGMGGFRNTTPYYPGTPTPGTSNTCPAPRPPSDVVISQVYGGGGNNGATYHNDFVELYNRGTATVDLTGWSLQYASSTGSGWDSNKQPLGGTIGAHEYYLIALASGGANGSNLPPANISGQINMAAGSGKIALVNSFTGLAGNCPIFDPSIKDLVGYGSADCGEGSTTTDPGTNTTALFRQNNGALDTDDNANDFGAPAAPNPNMTPQAPIVELGPNVLTTDPRSNGTDAPRDATIQVTFTEPVNVDPAWFTLTCVISGLHSSATFAEDFDGQAQYITPNDNFTAGEQCTVTIFKDRVHDVDLLDSGPNTDTLPFDYSWSFTVATGTAPPYPPSVHTALGLPGAAGSDPSNYLMEKPEFTISYNRDLGRPNWVSWHLSDDWVGSLARNDTFRPDPQVPPDWYRVQSFDFSGSGFDRGHMTPNADRDKETSIPINQATFLMSNMVAQAPGNNQGPWAAFEAYLRTLVEQQGDELYIVAGPHGTGGTGSLGGVTTTLADGHVTVPDSTWKVALVLPKGDDDLSRVSCSTRTIAVIMPNQDSIRNNPWENYLTTVDAVETLTGYDFFSNLPEPYQRCIEAGTNGVGNLPFAKGDQTITFFAPADSTYGASAFTVVATGGASGNPVTFTASGACTSGGSNGATITPGAPGSCTITASQAGSDLYNAATPVVRTLTVNKASATIGVTGFSGIYDAAAHGAAGTATGVGGEDLSALLHLGSTFTNAPGGTAHWTFDGDANYAATEGDVTIAITARPLSVVAANASRSHNAPNPVFTGTVTGLIASDGITVDYATPAGNLPGSYPIIPTLLDPDNRRGNYSVSLTNGTLLVTNVAPVAAGDGPYSQQWNTTLTVAAQGVLTNDTDGDSDPLTATVVTGPAHGTLALSAGGGFTYTPAADFSGADSFTYRAGDGFADSAIATVLLDVTSPCSASARGPNDCRAGTPIARDDVYATRQGDTLTVTAARDILDNDGRFAASALLVSAPTHGTLTLRPDGTFVYAPASAFYGLDAFAYAARSASGVVGPVATVRLVVRKNLAPDADNDFYAMKTNGTLTVAGAGVLTNDSDPDDDVLTAAVVSGPSHGTLTLSPGGAFVYKPSAGFNGTDTFVYSATDPFGHADTATVSIAVSRSGRDDDDHHGDESHHHDGDGCDHERGRNGHFNGDGCEHDRRR